MPKFGGYYEPEGSLLPMGDHLVKIKSAIRTRSRTKNSLQLEVEYYCKAGVLKDYIPIEGKDENGNPAVSFRVKQLMAAVSGKFAKDITKADWEKFNAPGLFGAMETDAEIDRLAQWLMTGPRPERPFFITVIEQADLKGVMRPRVGAFKDQSIHPCADAQVKDWEAPVAGSIENDDPLAGAPPEDLPF